MILCLTRNEQGGPMPKISIKNPQVDPKASELVRKVFEAIPDHWKVILPEIEVVISTKPFNRVAELREFCAVQNKEPGWKKFMWKSVEVVCPEFDDKTATLWVHYDDQAILYPPDYYFQKELYSVLAKLMWNISKKLRDEIGLEATGMAQDSQGVAYLAFRDSFSRFFLNPEYLQDKKPAAWSFMKRLDMALQC